MIVLPCLTSPRLDIRIHFYVSVRVYRMEYCATVYITQ